MFNLLKRVISQFNYSSVEDIRVKMLAFRSAKPPMISEEEYITLNKLLDETIKKKQQL